MKGASLALLLLFAAAALAQTPAQRNAAPGSQLSLTGPSDNALIQLQVLAPEEVRVQEEDAEYYEGELKAGRTIVTVNAGPQRVAALQILQNLHGYDAQHRAEQTTVKSGDTIGTTRIGRPGPLCVTA